MNPDPINPDPINPDAINPDPRTTGLTGRFRDLHRSGTFVMPNPWDLGSARYLEWRGFPALATTSSGFAATLGRADQQVNRDELLRHVEALTATITVPLNVDSERCFAEDLAGVARTVELLAGAGAAGCSIEDWNPATGRCDALAVAAERVGAAAAEAARHGLVLTARAEQHLHGVDDLDDTITRLQAYRAAGAEVVYAPGLVAPADITRVVSEVDAPFNLLALPGVPALAELSAIGVRRISTGGSLAWAAYGGVKSAVDEILDHGTFGYGAAALPRADRAAAFAARPAPGTGS
jgi:2-methylisocitrate lyase-like PEP mutase family enzyme